MFANKSINTGRQPALDYAKALAIVCMVICHTVMYLSIGFRSNAVFRFADDILGGPSVAPLFMICLGVGIVYSHRTTPLFLLKRGVFLFVGGYLLNFVRAGGALLLVGYLTDWHIDGVDIDLAKMAFFSNMIVDILQFAGLAFMFFALVIKLRINNWVLVVLAVVLPMFGHSVEGIQFGNRYLTALAGLFVPSGIHVAEDCLACFPFTLWILYPIFGYLYGKLLQRVTNLKLFYWIMLFNMGAVSFVYLFLVFYIGPHPFSETYYWHSLPNAFFYICLDMFIVAACHLLAPHLPACICNASKYLSLNMTRIYCISWCLIMWASFAVILWVDEKGVSPLVSYFAGILILITACYLQKIGKHTA